MRDLAALRGRGADGGAPLTAGRVSDAAAEDAAAESVEVVAGEALAGLIRDSDVRLPAPDEPAGAGVLDSGAVAERLAGYWPGSASARPRWPVPAASGAPTETGATPTPDPGPDARPRI